MQKKTQNRKDDFDFKGFHLSYTFGFVLLLLVWIKYL
jgi:hypothetical protein